MEREQYYTYNFHSGWIYNNPNSKEIKPIFYHYHRLSGPQFSSVDPFEVSNEYETSHYFTVHGVSLCYVYVFRKNGKWVCSSPDIDPDLLNFQ